MQESAVVVAGAATDALPEALVRSLGAGLRGELLRPGDEGYERSRQVWNGLIDKRPALIARCGGVADVIASVNFAREHGLLVSVRGGGHNVAGSAVCDGGLMIDLSAMRAVRVDPRARIADVQGGATWGDVDRETQAFGLAVSGGVVSTTGVAGLTLAGGYGWLRNQYGLTCDMLRSVDIVTADGKLLTANVEQNADLFWAVRGGGGNFGIVTNFEFDLAPIGTEVVFCAVMYPIDEARRVMSAWRRFVETVPDVFTTDCHLWAVPSLPGFPPELWGRSVVIVAGVYCGDLAEGERFTEPLRHLAEPLLDLSGRWPFLNVQQAFDPVFPHAEHLHYWKSLYLNRFDEEVWNLVLEQFARKPSPRTLVATRFIGGAVRRVPAAATAFGDRSAPFLISLDSTWEDTEATEANIAWTRGLWAALQPFSGGRTYFSFAGLMEEGDALVHTTFGDNYARLAAIKQKYDPGNFFRLNQNIKPAS